MIQSPQNIIILTQQTNESIFAELADKIGFPSNAIAFAHSLNDLDKLFTEMGAPFILISYSTSVIVPAKFLSNPGQLSVNVHAASPEYPGRDPHHYAVYDGVTEYGATLHYMTEKVDDGPIIYVERFKLSESLSPLELLMKADECAWIVIEKLLRWLKNGEPLPLSSAKWSNKKRSRKDFEQFCNINSDIEQKELASRINAFHVDGYNNLFTEIHGKRFYYLKEK